MMYKKIFESKISVDDAIAQAKIAGLQVVGTGFNNDEKMFVVFARKPKLLKMFK